MNIPRDCYTCAHDGQCVGLPYCGGLYWEPDYDEDEDEESESDAECAEEAEEDGE